MLRIVSQAIAAVLLGIAMWLAYRKWVKAHAASLDLQQRGALLLTLLALGGGFLSVGFLNGMDNLLSALYSFPGGYLSDRIGTKRALLVFNLIAMAGFGIVIVFPAWQAVIAGSVLFISWSSISLPATMWLIAAVLPAGKRTMGVSMHSLVNRVPMAPVLRVRKSWNGSGN